MSCAMDDIHIFFVFFSLDLTNLGGVTPKMKSTKKLSADNVVTQKIRTKIVKIRTIIVHSTEI